MRKLADKLGKRRKAVNDLVYKRASKLGISSEAALVVLAKEHGIGTAIYQRKLDPTKQAEVRAALPSMFISGVSNATKGKTQKPKPPTITIKQRLKGVIEYLIEDQELQERCQDMLMASRNFDRAINQATQVLENRIRKKAEPGKKLVGESLVNFAFNEETSRTVLRIASGDSDDQRGYTQLFRGVVPAFRNRTHHHIINDFSREEAMRVCGFIDVLLRAVDRCQKVK